MEVKLFNNFDFKLEEADKILLEANKIYDETFALVNEKSEALELYNEYKISNALEKHEKFVKKAHDASKKIKDKADAIMTDLS